MRRAFTKTDWDRYATCYDSLNELRPYVQMIEEIMGILRTAEYPLLDAGCGTGNLAMRLYRRHAGPIVGIDASHAMLDRAREKCAEVEFLHADLDSGLPFENGIFETVVCVNALYALKEPAKVLSEFFRVLRPHGSLIVATPKHGYENGLILKSHCGSEEPDLYWLNAHKNVAREERLIREAISDRDLTRRFLHIARSNRAIAHEHSFWFFTAEELSRLANETGFGDVRIKKTYACQNLLLIAKRMRERNA